MKSTFLSFLMVAALSMAFISCGDDNSCEQADWAGTYNGASSITSDGETQSDIPTTVTITANGTDLVDVDVEVDLGGGATETTSLSNITIDGCTVSQSQTGLSATMELDGNDLSLDVSLDIFGYMQEIEFTGSK